jgi:hypothetical protein
VVEHVGTQPRYAPGHGHQITVAQLHPLLHNTDMVKFLLLAAVCIFQIWLFYQFYKAWKAHKKMEQDWAIIHAQLVQTFRDTK